MVYPAIWALILKLTIMVMFAYAMLCHSFSGFLAESRRPDLGYLQGAVEY